MSPSVPHSPTCTRLAMLTAMAPDWSAREVLEHLHARGMRRVEWATHYPVGKLPHTAPWHLDLTPGAGNVGQILDLCQEFDGEVVCLSGPQRLGDEESPALLFQAASRLGCPTVRLSATGFLEKQAPQAAISAARSALRKWLARARELNVKILVETHPGNIACSPELALRLVEGFDPREVGVILDPGNMVIEGMLAWPVTVKLLGPYLAHVHVKNLGWFRSHEGTWAFEYTALQEGMVDWRKVVGEMEAAGYAGVYSFEDFRGGYCCLPVGIRTRDKLTEDIEFMRAALESLAPSRNHPPQPVLNPA